MMNKAKFSGLPKTEWLEDGRRVRLLEDFSFTDSKGHLWHVPKGTVCDGSSIPRFLWSIIGSPFVGKHRFASIVHDHFCVTKSMPHKQVHRMYFEACVCGGVNKIKARLMLTGIKIGGPKWA